MRYGGNYNGIYDNGRMLRGRYGEYGRRGVPGSGRGRYREGYSESYSEGEEILEDMKESYGAYSDSMGAYNRGNYGAEEDGMKALEDTMGLFVEFAQKMTQQVDSPEAQKIIKKSLQKISQMG